MLVLLSIGVASLVFAVSVLADRQRRREQVETWQLAAKQCGLTDLVSKAGFFDLSVEARSGDLAVRIEEHQHDRVERATRVEVHGTTRPLLLHLRGEGLATGFEKRFVGIREVELGDREFDDVCFVEGTAPLAFAVLDATTRRQVGQLLGGRLETGSGPALEVRVDLWSTCRIELARGRPGADDLARLIRGAIGAAEHLAAPSDLAARIAENLVREPVPEVRLNALLTLAREFPEHPSTRQAQLAALRDASAEVRLRAALALDVQGRETLLELASDVGVEDGHSAQAVAGLASQLPVTDAARLLRSALRASRPLTAAACLDALGRLCDAAAEPAILEALRAGSIEVRLAAVRALGECGTVVAVPLLRSLAEEAPRERRSAVRQAVAAIQSRLTGAGTGQLSLAPGEAGALSIVAGEAGALAIAAGSATARAEEQAAAPSENAAAPDERRAAPALIRPSSQQRE